MKIADVEKLEPVDRFLYWIKERHAIYTRRLKGQGKPWTDDEVMQRWFFTNPYRENDKTTVWFRENVRDPLRGDREVVFATICFRWFNYIPTGLLLLNYRPAKKSEQYAWGLLESWDEGAAIRLLNKARSDGPVFTGAFMIPAPPGSTKVEHVCKQISNIWKVRHQLEAQLVAGELPTLQAAHERLVQFPWLGNFMAYEIVTDLRHTYLLEDSPDIMTWCNPGPGAIRGLRRLLGLPIGDKGNSVCLPRPDNWQQSMYELLTIARRRLRTLPQLEMREIEHSLCEWDKYERARLQDGRMKRRYNGL